MVKRKASSSKLEQVLVLEMGTVLFCGVWFTANNSMRTYSKLLSAHNDSRQCFDLLLVHQVRNRSACHLCRFTGRAKDQHGLVVTMLLNHFQQSSRIHGWASCWATVYRIILASNPICDQTETCCLLDRDTRTRISLVWQVGTLLKTRWLSCRM